MVGFKVAIVEGITLMFIGKLVNTKQSFSVVKMTPPSSNHVFVQISMTFGNNMVLILMWNLNMMKIHWSNHHLFLCVLE